METRKPDVHELLQRMKLHQLFRDLLEGGEMLEWGAKTIPEGGFYSVPERRHGDGLLVIGDSAGYVEVSSLRDTLCNAFRDHGCPGDFRGPQERRYIC